MYYLYFMRPEHCHENLFKVGTTDNIEKRARQIESTDGYSKITVLQYVEVETQHEALFLEKFIHNFLRGYKVKGKKDWYRCDEHYYILSLVDTVVSFWQLNPELLRKHLDSAPYIWAKPYLVKHGIQE